MIDPDGQPEEQHPRPSHLPDIEYEDEPPGSYLGEFSVGTWKLCWSGRNILVVGLGAWVVPGEPQPAPQSPEWCRAPSPAGGGSPSLLPEQSQGRIPLLHRENNPSTDFSAVVSDPQP